MSTFFVWKLLTLTLSNFLVFGNVLTLTSEFNFILTLVSCVVSVWPEIFPVVVFFSIRSVGHCWFCFLSRAYGCNALLDYFTLMG